jgi:hypothetical protein
VPEDGENAREQQRLLAIQHRPLRHEVADQGLRHRKADRIAHVSLPIVGRSYCASHIVPFEMTQ